MNGWYENNDSESVFIFIHGLFSSSEKCWTDSNGVFWPDLIISDARFCSPSIYLAEFHTSPDSGEYGLKDCAKEVYDSILRRDEKLNSPPIDKSNIIFVAHSTGGIVARYIIDAYRDSFVGKNIGICLYASPSYGSKLAKIFGWFARLAKNKLAIELSWGGAVIEDLDSRFKELVGSGVLSIKGMEAYESMAPFRMPFIGLRVVEKESAARYFGRHRLIARTDHSSIVKPSDTSHPSHKALLDFVGGAGLLSSKKPVPVGALCLFDRYSPEVESYYIEREQDVLLERSLCAYSVWICGASGIGKTAAIARAISRSGVRQKYITLGSYVGASAESLLWSICNELDDDALQREHEGDVAFCVGYISDWISKQVSVSDLFLFIEEIPISDKDIFCKFSNYIYMVVSRLKDVSGFRLVMSSIYLPSMNTSEELMKTFERLTIMHWNSWCLSDIEKLVLLIGKVTGLGHPENLLIESFDGSPRKVKDYYRNMRFKISSAERR